jgi:N-methylhydantoinase B
MSAALDPVRIALVQNRLDHISLTMGWVMTRTARSPIFAQAHDFSCFLADAEGNLVSQADGIPIHTGGGGFAVRAILRDFGGRIAQDDVFLLNDPYAAGGNHLPDWVIARPVFAHGRLLAFSCNRAHQSDIGGGAAGTYNPEATEIWHEGLRLPPMRLVERGVVREDLWALLKLNCRTPDLLDGDLRAMLGSTRIGEERVAALAQELAQELGPDDTPAAFAAILDLADRRFRAALAELPDGEWRGEDRSDNDCFGIRDVTVRVRLFKQGDRLTVDFTGTDPQIRGFKNSSFANTASAVYTALSAFFDPSIPRNSGAFRCVELIAPEGSVVNARAPAPMTMCTVFVAHEIIHAIWRALSLADPSRACAGWAKNLFGLTAGKRDGQTTYVLYHANAAAGGGAAADGRGGGRDGFDQVAHLCTLGGYTLPNIEAQEQLYPVRYVRQEFRMDGGGPGTYRGGTGVEYEIDVATAGDWSFRGEGVGYRTGYGVQGGGWGRAGEMSVLPAEGMAEAAPKFGLRHYGPARMVARSPGGGGLGDPRRRPIDQVLADLRDGLISAAAARSDYGVVVTEGRLDLTSTRNLRA